MPLGTGRTGLSGPSTPLSFATLADLLAATPSGTMQATAYDAPGSMLYHDGAGKWAGSFGRVTATQVAALQTAIASIAVGAEAIVPNAAVPDGLSRLRRGASVWTPPSGEPICAAYATGPSTPIASLASGLLTVQQVYASAIIPDYMIPDGIWMMFRHEMQVKNTVSPQANSKIFAALNSLAPAALNNNSLIYSWFTPSATGTHHSQIWAPIPLMRSGSIFPASGGALSITEAWFSVYKAGDFVPGATRIFFMAQPSHQSDVVELFNFEMKAR